MGSYQNFSELRENEEHGKDYQIRFRYGASGIVVMSPHGGGIEPGTTEMADAIAGSEHGFYSFEGLKRRGNLDLHITSRQFDEPAALKIVGHSNTALVIHGCKGDESEVYIGGRDEQLKGKIKDALGRLNLIVQESPLYPGKNPMNICNRGRTGMGVQLEVSAGLRRRIFQGLSSAGRKETTGVFEAFVRAVRLALGQGIWGGYGSLTLCKGFCICMLYPFRRLPPPLGIGANHRAQGSF